MKTSNKLLLTALAVLLCTLAAYNMALKSEYETGAYKDPLSNHSLLSFQDFDEIEINATNSLKVKIEAGDTHQVYLQNDTEEMIQVSQEGKRLKINFSLADEKQTLSGHRNTHHIVIRTPEVKAIIADADFLHKLYLTEFKGVTVEGLKQEHLSLDLDKGSYVRLVGNQLNSLTVNSGRTASSEPLLEILPSNRIQQAKLNIRNGSYVELENVFIPQVSYTFSDSAHVNLSGASLSILKK